MTNLDSSLRSLEQGNWLKLICGASFGHLPAVRNLTLAYALAGADCIDVAADEAVIAAAREALQIAKTLAVAARARGYGSKNISPWLMVSLNDGEDPHFRKAEFDSTQCPPECPRPCQQICPAQAIVFNRSADEFSGVVAPSCYGCGRCLPICPSQIITAQSYIAKKEAIAPLVLSTGVDAVEIHTQVGRKDQFSQLWTSVQPWVSKLKLVAISCPDGEGLIDYLWSIYKLISPLPCALIWQTDGRPMSGDIGDGTTIAAIKLAQKVLAANLPGYVQLAGGTNSYTVPKLRATGMLKGQERISPASPAPPASISGIAYGSYARVLLSPILDRLEHTQMNQNHEISAIRLEEQPQLLWEAVEVAHNLVSLLKPSPTAC
ncbi:circadian clock protein LdpA [Aliterella atlantica]|uniref:4Fe-4S ferredoxin n=1 Tax=Aliterella atlantica CENA595 TaxID=1618023 RepID=A0A0D8ZVI6_9CYAN|nr:LdpA C-terminal domain-containing domain [Aliterella atlantica]KJH72484.1 4Fe-4S ferredoxin [Aliterella atlantica CENA595]